jgi:two-component system, OmpR family, response regulator BaeR
MQNTPEKRILIVEDEEKIAYLLRDYFVQANYSVKILERGDLVLPWLLDNKADVMLLDIMLPGLDGISVCREVRQQSDIPILMITAKVEEIDRLLGLEMGADDYICKPFSPREVVARVKAILRRVTVSETQSSELFLDEQKYQITYQSKVLSLTAVEFQLLKPMYKEPQRVFSRNQLMDNMYSDNRIVSDRTIDSHIKKLRKKLSELSPEHDFIESVYGVGYRMVLPKS